MDNIRIARLGDVLAPGRALISGPFGSNISSRFFVASGVPVIRGNNLTSGMEKFVDDGFAFLTAEKADELKSDAVQNDIIFTAAGTIGQVGIIPPDAKFDRYVISNKQIRARLDAAVVDPVFAFYWFSSPESVRNIQAHNTGSTIPLINLSVVRGLEIALPPVGTQKSIARVLGAIDDKIELNRRMNETLEAMAQAIFRDWFVDFGPVRRKLAGETAPVAIMGGLTPDSTRAAELAAMFPDDLSDDHLPFGWATARVEDLLELTYGKSLPKPARRPGSVPVYGSGGVGGYHDTALVAGPGIIVGRKGTVGSLFWEPEPFFAIDTVFCVLPKPGVSLHFAWQLLHTLGLAEMNTDAAVPGLNRSNVYRLEVPRAPAVVLQAFEDVAGPLRSLMDAKNAETRTLAQTRDYLLPRLMSGAVRVSEALEQDAAA